jgi:hypothetical protein
MTEQRIAELLDETRCGSLAGRQEIEAYRIAELECTLGELRWMTDHELAMTLNLLPKGVANVRALIGPPTERSAPVRDPRAPRISTPIERNTRKFLDRVYAQWRRGSRVDVEDCKLAAEITAHNLIRIPGFRWLGHPPHPPAEPAPWFTEAAPEHQALIRALTLGIVYFDRRRELSDGGRGGVTAALRIFLNLLDRLLPVATRVLLQPLHYELESLIALDLGITRRIHERPSKQLELERNKPPKIPFNPPATATAFFIADAPAHQALHQQLEMALEHFRHGGEFGDGGRRGIIAALKCILWLFERLLAPENCNLLRPLRYEIECLSEIDCGTVRPIHKSRDDRVTRGPKSWERSEFETACVLLADCLHETGFRSAEGKPNRAAGDAEAKRIASPAAPRLGIGVSEGTIKDWRKKMPRERWLGPNRLGELLRQRIRLELVRRAIQQGQAAEYAAALRVYLEESNFLHLMPIKQDACRVRQRNRSNKQRQRRRQRAARSTTEAIPPDHLQPPQHELRAPRYVARLWMQGMAAAVLEYATTNCHVDRGAMCINIAARLTGAGLQHAGVCNVPAVKKWCARCFATNDEFNTRRWQSDFWLKWFRAMKLTSDRTLDLLERECRFNLG